MAEGTSAMGPSSRHRVTARLPVIDRVTSDIDRYRAAAAGVELDMVRGGPDVEPSRMRAVDSGFGVTLCEARPGCTTISHTHIDATCLGVSYVVDSAPGTKWCGEFDIESGMSVIHQPDTEHTAINEPGTRFIFAIVDVDAVLERGEILEIPLRPWCPGEVDVVNRRKLPATPILAHFASDAIESVPARLLDDLLTAVALSLFDPDWDERLPLTKAVDSRYVVGQCIDFATVVGREPSISEMCLVARVGGRRLRQAFHDVCGVSPKRFFRHWVLCEAHDRLLAAAADTTVTRVATDLGVFHLGRFSTQYRELHGESPSETLRRAPVWESSRR